MRRRRAWVGLPTQDYIVLRGSVGRVRRTRGTWGPAGGFSGLFCSFSFFILYRYVYVYLYVYVNLDLVYAIAM